MGHLQACAVECLGGFVVETEFGDEERNLLEAGEVLEMVQIRLASVRQQDGALSG